MDDLISRQAAIRWVKTECNPYGKPTLDFESGEKVIEHLERMSSAQQRWIPVTERLPEKDGTYIVCLDDRSVFEYDYISKWWDDDAWQYCGKDVVAWMPLPDPWKGGEE